MKLGHVISLGGSPGRNGCHPVRPGVQAFSANEGLLYALFFAGAFNKQI